MNEQDTMKKIRTAVSEIWVDSEGILRVDILQGASLTLKDMEEGFEAYAKLGFGQGQKKGLQLLTGARFFTLDKEARDYGGKHGDSFFIAAAVVSDSIAMRFLVNMFNATQKHGVPFKAFSNVEEALEWLRKFKK